MNYALRIVYCAQLTLLRSHRWYNSSQNFAIFLSKESRESSIDCLMLVEIISVNDLKDDQAEVIHTYRVSAAFASSYARRRKSWRRSFQRILQYDSTRNQCLQIIATMIVWEADIMISLVLLLWEELTNFFLRFARQDSTYTSTNFQHEINKKSWVNEFCDSFDAGNWYLTGFKSFIFSLRNSS